MHRADELLDLLRAARVGAEQGRGPAVQLDVREHLLRLVAARMVVHRDLGAVPREPARHRRADAGRRSGDEHHLVLQVGDHWRTSSSYFRNSGEISFGRISGISGKMMISASIASMGTSMITVSLRA